MGPELPWPELVGGSLIKLGHVLPYTKLITLYMIGPLTGCSLSGCNANF